MQCKYTVSSLKQKIFDSLTPIITNEYIFLDLPYYKNIGDILIWQGTEDFLSTLPHSCLYKCAIETYKKPAIAKETIILLQGGGNFGDTWRRHTDFALRILNDFPDNKIIIMPKSIYYSDKDILLSDAKFFSKHKYLVICARDRNSYEILQEHFSANTILMLPDMAFCISQKKLKKYQSKTTSQENKTLFLKRDDIELSNNINYSDIIIEKEFDVDDWPTYKKTHINYFFLRCFLWAAIRMPIIFRSLTDIYTSLFFRQSMVKIGVRFISKYRKIYTTRLHAAILCLLLQKPFILFNNSYGKNSSFFETWLSEFDNISLYP